MQRRRLKRLMIGAFATCAVLADAGAAAAQAAAANEQVAITTPPAGSAAWVQDHSLDRTLPDPATADAGTVAAFFASLTPAQQQQLVREYPLVVGNLDGAPLQLRYQANRIAIQNEIDRAQAESTDPKTDSARRAADAIRVDNTRPLLDPGRQVLAFDPRGRGLVAEVMGDLATAKRIAVVVPGSDSDLSHHDNGEHPLQFSAGMARAVRAEEQQLSPGTPTAVIAWTDYVSPVGLGPDAVTSRLAVAAAPRLLRTLDGLRQTTSPVAPPALICHSYGSVVCGEAAPKMRGETTDMIVLGSPGMNVDSAAGLGTGVHVWATSRNPADWIGNVPYVEVGGMGHGADPTSPDFGAEVVSSTGAVGHAGYFDPGTASLYNFAAIALGDYQDVKYQQPS
ncbi:alpha/beta hydrolase [Kitasatospora viridis]|uniref:Alpha/beta hydrolase family protein n=1 Tax=Kitasatospora viridis TaxID=281105 RepID=A0A561ULK5_9ACTN|nr:alpha/beta hydrolase [Kitasatospora viridis]TWG00215.1 alpha/beta hydrolase family protein [Kitasatospora viridis]